MAGSNLLRAEDATLTARQLGVPVGGLSLPKQADKPEAGEGSARLVGEGDQQRQDNDAVDVQPGYYKRQAGEAPGGQRQGYFPTFQESRYLGAYEKDSHRSDGAAPGGANSTGPDFRRISATGGVWPYEPGMDNSNAVQRLLSPLDYVFRPFTPGETTVIQGPLAYSWLQLGASFPFLTRTLHPDETSTSDALGVEAERKIGKFIPLYIDVLSISAIVLYDSVTGPGASSLNRGWLSAAEISLRAGIMVTDRTSLLIHGNVYFIATSSKRLVDAYLDTGSMSGFANLNIYEEIGNWDVRIFDDVTPFSSRSLLYAETSTGQIETVGNYYVGVNKASLSGGSFWDPKNSYLSNTAGVTAGTFLGQNFRFLTGFARSDTWHWSDFGGNTPTEYLSAGLFYDGYEWWVAPSLTYTVTTHDFADPVHTVALNATAPLSHRAVLNAGIGYSFGYIPDTLNWHIGVNYDQTERLSHSFAYSSGYQDLRFGDHFYGEDLGYLLTYRLGARTTLGWSNHLYREFDTTTTTYLSGLNANFALGDYSTLRLFCAYSEFDNRHLPVTGSGSTWIYSATFSRLLATRLTGDLSYEYSRTANSTGTGYNEQVVSVRLTRSF